MTILEITTCIGALVAGILGYYYEVVRYREANNLHTSVESKIKHDLKIKT